MGNESGFGVNQKDEFSEKCFCAASDFIKEEYEILYRYGVNIPRGIRI